MTLPQPPPDEELWPADVVAAAKLLSADTGIPFSDCRRVLQWFNMDKGRARRALCEALARGISPMKVIGAA